MNLQYFLKYKLEGSYTPNTIFFYFAVVFRLYRMHEMHNILTDVRGVSQSVCLSVTRLKSAAARAVCAGSFGAAFVNVFRHP